MSATIVQLPTLTRERKRRTFSSKELFRVQFEGPHAATFPDRVREGLLCKERSSN